MSGSLVRRLRKAIRGQVLAPHDPGFATAAHVFNTRFDHVFPLTVARPVDGADVRDAIRFTVPQGVRVRARSGGHSYAGYSTLSDGIVLDLRRLNRVHFDKPSGRVTVGAGAQLIDLYAGLAPHGVAVPGGSCPSVGIAGVTLGGGFGLAGRHLGLTIDSLRAATIVTADGALRTVDQRSHPDLFWALRGGGGGNFGIVTQFVFQTHSVPANSTFFQVRWPWPSADEAIDAWQQWAPHTNDRITSILHLNAGGPASINANGQYLGPAGDVPRLLAPLLSVPGATLSANHEAPFLAIQLLLANCDGKSVAACHTVNAAPGGTLRREAFNAKSDYVATPLNAAGRAAMIAAAEAPGRGSLLCDAYGGAVARIDPTATAFAHRHPLFCIQYYGVGAGAGWIDQAWTKLRPHVSGRAYQNYMDPALTDWQDAYYAQNLKRLESIRVQIDPHHYFNFPRAIGR
ncbi:MAG TPA: FAD-binding oxidoreductase [Solirubrobacteraceae bacterium]|nr:FAD-binding oxidoreductase [Solirubrobacteraceae bacterium]